MQETHFWYVDLFWFWDDFLIVGDQVAMFSELNYQFPVTDVAYHPRDHMIALCALGDNQPILIYNYNPRGNLSLHKDDILSILCNRNSKMYVN